MDKQLNILLVEDDRGQARILKNHLIEWGHNWHSTHTKGEDAIESLKQSPADLVLMDIDLEGSLDGISTAKIIRKKWRLPIIFLTMHDDDLHFQLAEETEPIAFLSKPYNFVNLKRTIQLCFGQKVQNEQLLRSTNGAYFIPDGERKYLKVDLNQLCYTHSSGPYQSLFFMDQCKEICLDKTSLLAKLVSSGKHFIEVNEHNIINVNHIDKIDGRALSIQGKSIGISKNLGANFFNHITFLSKSKKGK